MNINTVDKVKKNKHLKLLKAYNNNIKISDMNLNNKYTEFEQSKIDESRTLLYEIEKKPTRYKRYFRGQIIRIKFGVNIGSEFSGEHFAIVISKRDTMLNPVIHVIPLTSKKHNYNFNIGNIIYCKEKINILKDKMMKSSSNLDRKEIGRVIRYYSNHQRTISYACIKHLKTISKLSVCRPINKYDYINELKVPSDTMKQIDREIISEYTLL